MADKGWRTFPTATTAADNDIFSFLDVSEVDPNISNIGITKANLITTLGVPNAVVDVFTATASQTIFTASSTPINNDSFSGYRNGQRITEGPDYTLVGTTFTWQDPGGDTLDAGEEIVFQYNDVGGGGSPVNSVFGRTGDVTATLNDYDASEINNDSSVSGATVGAALDFVNTKENIVKKTFGDSPYAANAGEVIFVDTSGGNVIVTVPLAVSNSGARIRVNKTTTDTNIVTVNPTGGDTIGGNGSWSVSHFGDGITAISDGVTEWCLVTERHATGFLYFLPDHDGNLGSHRIQNIGATSNANFEFRLPGDFDSFVSLDLELTPTAAGSAGPGKDIDLVSTYGGSGELYNIHTETDNTSTYDTGTQNVITSIDISGVFTSASASDVCGINVDHNGVGGNIAYFGIALTYNKKG